jgi:predicted negative regulator of RcsB-dependent stress response
MKRTLYVVLFLSLVISLLFNYWQANQVKNLSKASYASLEQFSNEINAGVFILIKEVESPTVWENPPCVRLVVIDL